MTTIKPVLLFTVFLALSAFAQQVMQTDWDQLQNIEFAPTYVAELKTNMMFPKFPKSIKDMQGKMVQIEGYVIPFDPSGKQVALSANPYASCYFCGKAGPASVMTVNLSAKKTYRTDAYKKFKGILRLNDHDINNFYYILENAEQVK